MNVIWNGVRRTSFPAEKSRAASETVDWAAWKQWDDSTPANISQQVVETFSFLVIKKNIGLWLMVLAHHHGLCLETDFWLANGFLEEHVITWRGVILAFVFVEPTSKKQDVSQIHHHIQMAWLGFHVQHEIKKQFCLRPQLESLMGVHKWIVTVTIRLVNACMCQPFSPNGLH